MKRKVNFTVSDEGTVVFITPISETARQWVDENLGIEDWAWLGEGFAVDHRYADDIIESMNNEVGGIQRG